MKTLISFFFLFLILNLNHISAQTFGEKHILSTGGFTELSSFTTVDLDMDGDNDVIASDYQKNYISFFENKGTGDFSFIDTIPSRLGIKVIKAEDIDNDGDDDIIIGLWGSAIGWRENLGDMTFSEFKTIISVSLELQQISIVDINNDSLLDIVFYKRNTISNIAYCKNLGNGEFSAQIIIYSGPSLNSFQCVDMDTDNDIDILCLESETNKTSWLENDGTGQITDQHLIYFNFLKSKGTTVHAFDYDNDNDYDVVIGFTADSLWLFENNGQNQYLNKINISGDNHIENITSFDYNNDSTTDLIYNYSRYSYNRGINILLNTPGNDSLFIENPIELEEIIFAKSFELANINADEDMELIVETDILNPTIVWLKKDSETIYAKGNYVSSSTPNILSFDLANIVGNQYQDLFVYCARADNVIFQNNGVGLFDTVTFIKKITPSSAEYFFYDFDNDGDDDMLKYVMRYYPDSQNFIFGKNNGDLTFDTLHRYAPHHQYHRRYLNDYNNNGYTNVVEIIEDKVYLYDCMPSFDIILKDSFSLHSDNFGEVILTDIDLDGCNDLIIPQSYAENKIHFYQGENYNCFTKHNIMPGTYPFVNLKTAHINDDEYIDFYFSYDNMNGWLENLDGQYFARHEIDINYGYWDFYPIDTDNDGIDEILLYEENKIYILKNILNGGEITDTIIYGNIDEGIVFDIDYDGDLDFITHSAIKQECAWLENNLITTDILPLNQKSEIIIYPNPTSDYLVTNSDQKIQNISIFNLLGQTVISIDNPDSKVDVSYLENGIYIISIVTGHETSNQKLIIRK